jgi:hypothetical protein
MATTGTLSVQKLTPTVGADVLHRTSLVGDEPIQ